MNYLIALVLMVVVVGIVSYRINKKRTREISWKEYCEHNAKAMPTELLEELVPMFDETYQCKTPDPLTKIRINALEDELERRTNVTVQPQEKDQ